MLLWGKRPRKTKAWLWLFGCWWSCVQTKVWLWS